MSHDLRTEIRTAFQRELSGAPLPLDVRADVLRSATEGLRKQSGIKRQVVATMAVLVMIGLVAALFAALRAAQHPESIPAAPAPSRVTVYATWNAQQFGFRNSESACATHHGGIIGEVRDGRKLATFPPERVVVPADFPPVPGATVRVPKLGLTTVTDSQGCFVFGEVDVPAPCVRVDIEISAPGFGPWEFIGVVLRPAEGLNLSVLLSTFSTGVHEHVVVVQAPIVGATPVPC